MAFSMELKATAIGKRLAQHPYYKAQMLPAGVEVSGDQHQYIIPFNQLTDIICRRGLVWGELEFQLVAGHVVRLHGTEWRETRHFYQHLLASWQLWTAQMVEVTLRVLDEIEAKIAEITQVDRWVHHNEIAPLKAEITKQLAALPLAKPRLLALEGCATRYQQCLDWLETTAQQIQSRNQYWAETVIDQHRDFFDTIEASPLNASQCHAVVNGEPAILVLAGAGSGKTSVLVARAAWLQRQQLTQPAQLLLLAFGHDAAQELKQRLTKRVGENQFQVKTFHALARYIIQEATHKTPKLSELATDEKKRQQWFIDQWIEICQSKKTSAKGWRQWLTEELNWQLDTEEFWLTAKIQQLVANKLARWVSLWREQGRSQTELLAVVDETQRAGLSKQLRLVAPFVKAWNRQLKQEGATDFTGLIQQACSLITKGRFISPWKHILVDEFQDISPARAQLLSLLKEQNRHTQLFAVGDDWQAIYRFAGAEISLTTAFHHYFGEGASCYLDTTYRFNQRIGQIANQFIQRNPAQLPKTLNSLTKGTRKSISLLPESQLENLLNKMSGYVAFDQRVMILGRYHHQRPELLELAATRWPNLSINFMTIHASKGNQADHVILLGLNNSADGFPAITEEAAIEQALLPVQESYPHAEERRLAYVAMTRAKSALWLLYDSEQPSCFVEEFNELGVPMLNKA